MKALRLAAGAALSLLLVNAYGEQYYQSKTPYAPQQEMASYEAAPPGYRPVYTQMLARHGSRGLSSFKADLALYNLWRQAGRQHALTPLGQQLGPDIRQLMKANFLLGYGVDGISKPGYGNETMQGVDEHTQLAQRLYQRLPQLFKDAAGQSRQIVVVTSGKDRAVDSGYFFTRSLLAQQASLAPLLAYPDSLAPRAETSHDSRPKGTDRYLLYYQAWLKSDALRAREAAILAQPGLAAASKTVLERLFTPAFVASLEQGRYRVANTGTYSYTSADGKFTNTLIGDGDTVIASATDAALALYELYAAAADMRQEVAADFTRYVPPAQAQVFAFVDDAQSFYAKGPGIAENGDLNYRMAHTLLGDFFSEVDAVAGGDLSHAAKLRFSHAEIVIPMAAILGLPGMAAPLPRATMYSYDNNPWRGATVAPMAANIQWDVYTDGQGSTLVRMLYNEKETGFKPACDSARMAPGSHFYRYSQLKSCYQH